MAQPLASTDDIDITALFRSIRRRFPRVVFFSLLAGGLTYLGLSMLAPEYLSKSELMIRAKGTANPFTGPRVDGSSNQVLSTQVDKQAINTHVRALQSPDLVEKIANKLHLSQLREFNSALGPYDAMGRFLDYIGLAAHDSKESLSDRVRRAFYERLQVYSPTESRIITIAFSSLNPQLAADIANMMAQDYRSRLANATVFETDAVQKALQPKIAHLTQEVTAAEAEVARYRSKTGLLRGGAQKTPLNQQQLGDLMGELTRASAARSSLQASAETARNLITRGNPEIIPQVQRSPLIQNLIQQRVRVERDLRKYLASMKPAHPVIRQLNADLRSVKRQISFEVANLVASLDKEAYVAVEREASIKKSIETIKSRVADNSGDQVELGRLEAVAKSKRSELSRLQAQYEANRARADSGVVPVEAEIVTAARPASVPSFPHKGPFTALVAAATFLFGLAWVITSSLLKAARGQGASSHVLRDEIVNVAARPVPTLRDAPQASCAAASAFGIINVTSPRELAGHLKRLASVNNSPWRTLLVSNGEAEKTVWLAKELGLALGGLKENTILIDWNQCGDGLLVKYDEETREPGMMDLLQGTARFADVVKALPDGKTHFIAGGRPLKRGEVVDAEKLNIILDALDSAYSQVVLMGEHEPARELFETIEGRVDVGVLVDNPRTKSAGADKLEDSRNHEAAGADEINGTFLGFEIGNLSVFRFIGKGAPVLVSSVKSRIGRSNVNEMKEPALARTH